MEASGMGRWMFWILIAALLLVIIPINWPGQNSFLGKDTHLREGLDLQGGIQILLEADVPADRDVTSKELEVARKVIEDRVNALGLSEPVVQVSPPRRIVVELPGYDKPDEAVALIKNTALLEFVEVPYSLSPGTEIQTDFLASSSTSAATSATTETVVATPTGASTPTPAAADTTPAVTPVGTVFHTIMTGAMLVSAQASRDEAGQPDVLFTLTTEGAQIFADYTTNHVNGFLAIVLDKKVISSPSIGSPIPGGNGRITGKFTIDEANQLAIYLSYGSLPIPLKVIRNQSIGPSLGQDSLRRSLIAGLIGLSAVVLFMLLYYRLPGAVADLALLMYALTSLAIYRLIPVTFTLPGIAGFILSVGMAVDANVLIFERMKEELRGGKVLRDAVNTGFTRAWSSIRDSNISTLITCSILYYFGTTFGASIVKGFAITLAIGVLVSMFTAIVVTRNLLHLVLDRIDFSTRHSWFGIAEDTKKTPEKTV
jgi:preprotein translocase subunit SecD